MTRHLAPPPTDEPLDTLVFRPLAAGLVRRLARTRVTPNQVSLAGALAGIAAAGCLWRGGLACVLGAPVLLFASLVFDVTDGQLARFNDVRSHAGWVMDILADGSKGIAIMTALALALARERGAPGLAWGLAAAVSVLVQVLARDASLHRFERDTAPACDSTRVARIDEERRRLREGPLTLARLAMAAHDLALRLPLARATRADRDPRPLTTSARQRRLVSQGLFRHLGGTAQLVTVAIAAAAGHLLPAAILLVLAGNALLAVALVFDRATIEPR